MTAEAPHPEKKLSPRESTVAVIHLLERLPIRNGEGLVDALHLDAPIRNSFVDIDNGVTIFNAQRAEQKELRERGLFKAAYMKRYKEIMSPAELTTAGREFMDWSLEQGYDIGVDKDDKVEIEGLEIFELHKPVPLAFIPLLNEFAEHPESPGIFEKESAGKIEVQMYEHAQNHFNLLRLYMLQGISMIDSDSEPEMQAIDRAFMRALQVIKEMWNIPVKGESMQEIIQNYTGLFSSWRIQLQEKHGITISPDASHDSDTDE